MIRNYYSEEWKPLLLDEKIAKTKTFKISNYGRIISNYKGKETLLKLPSINGYTSLALRQVTGKRTSRYVHKLVAQHFLEKKENDQYVIHLDYDKTNNHISNLKWATKRQKELHQFKNPLFIKSKPFRSYSKLKEGHVKMIKRKLFDPNNKTRVKMIAKQFGVSEMQIYRIKSGENWSTVTEF